MRIAIIAGAFAPNRFGSPAVLAEQTAIGLQDRGHEVFVITAMDQGAAGHGLSRWEVSGIPVIGIGTRPGELGAADAGHGVEPSIQPRAAQILSVIRPDVIHAHSPRFLGAGPVRAAQETGIPTAISIYGNRGSWPADVLSGASRLLVSGPQQRAELLAVDPDPSRLRIVPHGATPPAANWQRPGHTGPLRFAYLGGMAPDQGYQVVLAALTKLRRTDYELHVVDRATARGVRAIRDWDFRVPGLLRLQARFPPPVRDRFFGGFDVLLALPQDPDSPCLSVREALLRGVWPIASDIEAAAQVIRPGTNGTLVPATSPDRVAEAIGWAIDNRSALAAARDAGTMGSDVPTVDDQVSELEDVYAEMMA